ncbi:restriction endonuclease subunit S [uncultured Desulfuromonas sp.]|uniref:restriction endonuclease subunit S n=1 Tax=uncultured Desulfuromonas sp. TaxID=181013 RepID=UPI002AABACFB|nr:restriction endonuclease subunit S [uncultured Desulfuromonas sp.]
MTTSNVSIDLTPSQRNELLTLLKIHLPNTEVWAYGSRVKWTSRPDSDLDLVAFVRPDQKSDVSFLREAFEESSLPFRVDFFVWDEVPEKFRENIEAEHVVLVEKSEKAVSGEWQEEYLTDLYEISSGLSKPAKDFGSGFPFLAFKDVFNNYFVPDKLTELVESSTQEQRKCSVKRGDVFLTRTSETMDELGMSSVALKDYPHATFNGFTKRLRPKKNNQLVPEYVGYFLRSPRFRNEMLAFSTMSTRASLNNEMINRLKISFPPPQDQKAIAWALKTLDDKIELNRQMNATLEAMAQALFKSWFVDFDPVIDNALAAGNPIPDELKVRAEVRATLGDQRKPLPEAIQKQFPSSFVLSDEMGWIPEGWEGGRLSEIAELRTQSVQPNKEPDKQWSHFSIPAFDEGMWPTLDMGETIKSGKYSVPQSCVLASKLNPQFPRVWMPDVEDEKHSICSTEFMPFVPLDPSERAYLYSFFCSEMIQTEIANRVTGSTGSRQRVKPKEIAELPIVVVPHGIRRAYSSVSGSLFSKSFVNQREVLSLAKLRDTLLPKLLSGQLRIPDAEKLVADAL